MHTPRQDMIQKRAPNCETRGKFERNVESKPRRTVGRKPKSEGKSARRGRPPKVDEETMMYGVILAALNAYQSCTHDEDDDAEALLSSRDWPLIRVIRQTTLDQYISAWQALGFIIAAAVDDEIGILETQAHQCEAGPPKRQKAIAEEIAFVVGYILGDNTLESMGNELGCDGSRVKRALKQPIYKRIVRRAYDMLSDTEIRSLGLLRELQRHGDKRKQSLRKMR